MAELVLNRCVFVESRCHGQGHLNTLILQEKHNITIYKSIGIKRLKLILIFAYLLSLISQEKILASKAIQQYLNLLARLGTEVAIAVHALDSISYNVLCIHAKNV